MPKLYRLSGRETVYFLEKLGFVQIRQRGSHVVLRKKVPGGHAGCVVPLHPELAIGTLRGILKQAGITIKAYPALVDKGESVSVRLFETPQAAAEQMRQHIELIRILTDKALAEAGLESPSRQTSV